MSGIDSLLSEDIVVEFANPVYQTRRLDDAHSPRSDSRLAAATAARAAGTLPTPCRAAGPQPGRGEGQPYRRALAGVASGVDSVTLRRLRPNLVLVASLENIPIVRGYSRSVSLITELR